MWLNGLQKKVEDLFGKKEFGHVYKIYRAIQVCDRRASLLGFFSHFNTVVDGVVAYVKNVYDEIAKQCHNSLESEDWAKFRSLLSVLEGLREIEGEMGKSTLAQTKATIEQKITKLKEHTVITDRISVSNTLIELNQLSSNVPQFKEKIEIASGQIITEYGKGEGGDERIYELGVALNATEGTRARMAREVVSCYGQFNEVRNKLQQEKTAKQTIQWALGYWGDTFDIDPTTKNNTAPPSKIGVPRFLYTDSYEKTKAKGIWGDCVQFCKGLLGKKGPAMLQQYKDFSQEFDRLYVKAIVSGIAHIVENTKYLFLANIEGNLVKILAHICVVWSRQRAGHAKGKNKYKLFPHPIQVLCFLRLLEGSPSKGYFNQLIEVLTGEGKSIVLGVVAIYFGLLGYDVYSICYSSYLSRRDYTDFVEIFEIFGIQDRIVYSTIKEMCEITINQTGSIRDLTKSVIESATKPVTRTKPPNPNSILLIDEVDVFFGSDFYGNTYNPATMVSNEHTYELLNFIYSNRASVKIDAVIKIPSYTKLIELFPKLKLLINHEIRKMLKDVKSFENTPEKPIILNNDIHYKDQDGLTCKQVYRYKTCFQYIQKYTEGDFKDIQSVKDHVGMYIGYGNFSFAEIPVDFKYKMGVSGTLQSLTNEEKAIVQSYGIQRLAYAPSIYGGSRCNQSTGGASPITFCEPGNWYLRIAQSTRDQINVGRAVLIFFENLEILEHFAKYLTEQKTPFQLLTEKEEFKELIVKQSTASQMITLCTRPFGRGVDFIVLDPKTSKEGGVHVIQTFVAACEAEQIQIRGRAARQGDPGSHEFILSHPYLKKYLGTIEGQPKNTGFEDYTIDNELTRTEKENKIIRLRDVLYKNSVKELEKKRAIALAAHDATKLFYKKLLGFDGTQQQRDEIINALMELNKGTITSAASKYHLFFCLDESGSMSGGPWKDLLGAVTAFINKRIECCNSNGCVVEDLVTVVNYASSARVIFESQAISPSLVNHIDFRSGGTVFPAGLNTVNSCIAAKQSGWVPCLIFMSDGGDSQGDAEMEAIVQQTPGIQVFVIGFGSGCDRPRMMRLAEKGKGQFFYGADGSQLKGEFEKVSVKISGGVMAL